MPVPAPGSGAILYATLEQLKAWLGIDPDDTQDDALIVDALTSVSREIEDVCGRSFGSDLVASTRTADVVGRGLVRFDDFYTTSGLAITVDGTAWDSTDYTLMPRNGVVNGRPGWPYNRLAPTAWPTMFTGSEDVAVTALWGWSAVPDPVHQACIIASSETLALKDARFGVAGFGANGDIRVRDNPMVMSKLKPYIRHPVKVA